MNLDLVPSEREKTLEFFQRIKRDVQVTDERKALHYLANQLDSKTLELVTTTYVSNDIIEICNSSIGTIEDSVKMNEVKLGGTEFIFLETPVEIEGQLTKEVHFLLVIVTPESKQLTFLFFQSSDKINGCMSVPFDTTIAEFWDGRYIADAGHSVLGRDKTLRNYTKLIKYYLAICSWRSSKIVVNDVVPVGRAFKKRARHLDTNINIVKLRRKESNNHTISGRTYSHQWIVRGFFRRQWYPKSQTHKLIFVDSFVKGPAGTELKVRQQVHLVTR